MTFGKIGKRSGKVFYSKSNRKPLKGFQQRDNMIWFTFIKDYSDTMLRMDCRRADVETGAAWEAALTWKVEREM